MTTWTTVGDQFPKSGLKVLATYLNCQGKRRAICAMWVAPLSIEADLNCDENWENGEDEETYYLKEGWYERIENWDEYSSVVVNEGEVTHWMELPSTGEL